MISEGTLNLMKVASLRRNMTNICSNENLINISMPVERCAIKLINNKEIAFTHNGTVCTVERDRRSDGVQIITFTEKLTNLKY